MVYIIIDIVIALILALFIWRGAAKGFVLTLCGLLAVLVAVLGASFLADALAPKVGQALEPKFQAVIEERLEESLQTQADDALQGVSSDGEEEVPLGGVLDFLRRMGFYDELIDKVEAAAREGLTQAAADAAAAVAAAVAQSVAYAIIFLVAFVLVLVVWTILSHVLDLVTKLPGLHTLNKLGGAVMGGLKGLIILFVAAWLLRFTDLIPPETADQTILLHFFLTTNPVTLLTGI